MSLDQLHVVAVSQRQNSSHSQRSLPRTSLRIPITLQLSKQPRLTELLNILVERVTAEDGSEEIREAVDVASKRIDQMRQPVVPDLTQIEARYKGHIVKARINMQDALADLMHARYSELKCDVAQHKYLDVNIKLSTLPHHLHFLLLLSAPPTATTLLCVETMLQRDNQHGFQTPPLNWEKILLEEPFEGEHWEGVFGRAQGGCVEACDEDASDYALSILGGSDIPEETASSFESSHSPKEIIGERQTWSRLVCREVIEILQAKQYWQSGWSTDADINRQFNLGDASTLGPSTSRILLQGFSRFAGLERVVCHLSYINEVDAVREVLLALQGRRSCLFHEKSSAQDVRFVSQRRIIHLTHDSQASILGAVASHISTLSPLRDLVRQIHGSSAAPIPCRTWQAFAASIDRQLALFDRWCAEKEELMNLSQRGGSFSNHVISLLGLEKEVGMKLSGTFYTLLSIARIVEEWRVRLSPPALSALILNTLHEAARSCSDIGDTGAAQSLMDVFRETAEPLWINVGRWLKDGIPVKAGFDGETYTTEPTWDDKEFFIRMNPLVDLRSPDFWESSYTLLPFHHSHSLNAGCVEESGIPIFLQHLAEDILSAGKAIGLLRALNMSHLLGDDWFSMWSTFWKVTETLSPRGLEDLEDRISDALVPSCRCAQSWFRKVLVDECDLWVHIRSLEQVYLMMRGDAMSQFGEKLFARMDTGQSWSDFHFLNSAFRDVSNYGSWINPSLVRISHSRTKEGNISQTVCAIDGLSVEYAIPFPLTFLFGPKTRASYSSIFRFLLQIKRSKNVLDRILIRGLNCDMLSFDSPALRTLYALRGKLSWFVNVLMGFMMTNVIHSALIDFHEALRNAASLDEMILIHQAHLERLLGRCLLQENTSALHRAILSILDTALHFSKCLTAFAGDTSLDVSRHSLLNVRRRHRRRDRGTSLLKSDIKSFTESLSLSDDDVESEVYGDVTEEPSVYVAGAIAFTKKDFFARLERMNVELDGLLRFVHQGVESLTSGHSGVRKDVAATFGILAFALEPVAI